MIECNAAAPSAVGSVSAGLAASLVDYATAQGADRADVLACANLAETRLIDIDGRVELDRYLALIEAAKLANNDQALVLRWAEAVGMADVSIVGLIMEASATMGDAFFQLQRYGRLAMEINAPANASRYKLVECEGELLLVECAMPWGIVPALTESAFVRLVCGPRRFLDQPHVRAIHLAYDPPVYRSEYERIFRCPVHFNSSRNAMVLHPETPSWRVAQYPRYAFGILAAKADTLLGELDSLKTMRGQVEAALLPILHEGEVSADRIAAQVEMSRQTLFRRLQREGTSFREILKNLRQRLAIDYLRGRKVSVNETAYLVGFSEPAAFSRAFKRWTGRSPQAFRQQDDQGRQG